MIKMVSVEYVCSAEQDFSLDNLLSFKKLGHTVARPAVVDVPRSSCLGRSVPWARRSRFGRLLILEHHPALAKPNLEAGSDNVSCRQLLLGLGSNPDSLQLTAVAQTWDVLKLTQKKTLQCVHPDLKPRN